LLCLGDGVISFEQRRDAAFTDSFGQYDAFRVFVFRRALDPQAGTN
jgi:hypothetical protein